MALLTRINSVNTIDLLVQDISTSANTSANNHYYVGLGRYTAFENDNVPDTETLDFYSAFYEIQRDLMMGIRVNSGDIKKVIPRKDWSTNKKYTIWDSANTDLFSSANGAYVITDDNRVYVCLDNNYGANSTVKPSSTSNSSFVTVGDGYKWKFLYSINSEDANTFNSPDYVVVQDETDIVSSAVNGAIHTVIMTSNGTNYSAYGTGFVNSVTNSTVFTVSFNNTNQATAGANSFANSTMYINTGGSAGELREILEYDSSSQTITVNNAFSNILSSSTFTIGPKVTITGDGTGAVAYANVDSTTNTVIGINMLEEGSGYTSAGITITAAPGYVTVNATARAIIGPPSGGHGLNNDHNLGCEHFKIVKQFEFDDSTLPTYDSLSANITFRTSSLIKNPNKFGLNAKYTNTSFSQVASFGYDDLGGATPLPAVGTYVQSDTANGYIVSAIARTSTNGVFYVANTDGTFANNQTLRDSSNNSIDFRINNTVEDGSINNPQLDKYSGEVLYYDNVSPITRSNTQTETVSIVIKV